MAELLVLTTGGASRTHFRGDVVTVQPDGFAWSDGEAGEAAKGVFTIIKVPGAPVGAFAPLLGGVDRNGVEILYRRIGLNLLALGPSPSFADVQAAMVEKTVIPLLT